MKEAVEKFDEKIPVNFRSPGTKLGCRGCVFQTGRARINAQAKKSETKKKKKENEKSFRSNRDTHKYISRVT